MTRETTAPEPHEPPKHDAGYKSMFGSWRMVEQLLRGLFGDLARGLDLSTLRRLPADFVMASGLLRRAGDRLWRVDFQAWNDPAAGARPVPKSLLDYESPRLYRLLDMHADGTSEVATQVPALVEGLSEADRIDVVAAAVIQCDTGEEFIAQTRSDRGVAGDGVAKKGGTRCT